MNIFVLDKCPIKAAKYQCDVHVVKMILETAQLLCSVFPENTAPYKRTHYNHPCTKWTRETAANYLWLISHGEALCKEYNKRYGKIHKSTSVIEWCKNNWKPEMFGNGNVITPFPACMPEDCKTADIVESYRNYYKKHKKDFAKWKLQTPHWWTV